MQNNPVTSNKEAVQIGPPPFVNIRIKIKRLSYFYDIAMVFGYAFLPFFGVAWLGDLVWDAVGVPVRNEASVRILSLDVSVDELDKKQNLQVNPLVEDLLSIVH